MSSNCPLSSLIPFEDSKDPEFQKYKWQIFNFTENLDEKITEFKKFSIDGNEFTLFLTLYPKGMKVVNKKFVSIDLNLFSFNKSIYEISTQIYALDAAGEVTSDNSLESYSPFLNACYSRFLERGVIFDESNNLLPGKVLTIILAIMFIPESNNTNTSSAQNMMAESRLGQYCDNAKFSDVIFAVEDQEFKAHKIILAFQSDVFAAMFENKMEETTLNRVTITDVGAEVFKEMLNFIYSGNIQNLNNMVYDILPLADKYNLEKLKVICVENLFINISIENAIKTLLLAERHSVEDLKAFTEHFISEHITEIMKTEDWKSLIQVKIQQKFLSN